MSPRKATPKDPLNRKVHEVMPLAEDMELHVSTLAVGDEAFVDVRTFVQSQNTYGRGVAIPMDAKLLRSLAAALTALARSEGR